MTRREAILGLAALGYQVAKASEAREFWNEKKPADWSKDERDEMLKNSPWAHDAEAKFNGGPGLLGGPDGYRRARPGAIIYGPAGSGPTQSPGKYAPVVRWESALPVRQASGAKMTEDMAAYYIVSLTGDLPGLSRETDETEDEHESRLENLKQYTRLEKRGGPIYLAKFDYQPGKGIDSGMRFYFGRSDPVTLHDGQVTFVTRLGPIDVKCKFPLKEMVYQGKLEL